MRLRSKITAAVVNTESIAAPTRIGTTTQPIQKRRNNEAPFPSWRSFAEQNGPRQHRHRFTSLHNGRASLFGSEVSSWRCSPLFACAAFYPTFQSRTMKPGTLVAHRKWGKAIVLESNRRDVLGLPVAMVRWLKPVTSPQGREKSTSSIYVTELTIISGVE